MGFNNTKRSLRNISSGIFHQLILLVLGIIIPRLILVNLGSEANGLLGLIRHILVYVSLLEAGVGLASLQALYGPIARGDRDAVSGILVATDRFYKRAGIAYLLIVIVLTGIFPFAVRAELPRLTVALVVIFSGLPGAVNFYFQGKFISLLNAEGKHYLLINLSTLSFVLTSLLMIFMLLNGYDVVALQLMFLLVSLLQTFAVVQYVRYKYRWLDMKAVADFSAISQSKNAFVHQISGLVFHNTDLLLLTIFIGLKTVSIYTLYAMLFGVVSTLIQHFGGANFILGQTFNTDRSRYLRLHDTYEMFNMTLTFSLFCVTHLFVLPFMRLYTAGVTDINYIDVYLPVLFIATYLLSNGRNSSIQAIMVAGHFRQTQWRSLLESALNLTVSLSLVSLIGIYGVLIGTIVALLYRTNDMIIYANKFILGRNPWITYRRWLLNLFLYTLVYLAFSRLLALVNLDSYAVIILWAGISTMIIVPLFLTVACLFERETFLFGKNLLLPSVRAGLNKLRRK